MICVKHCLACVVLVTCGATTAPCQAQSVSWAGLVDAGTALIAPQWDAINPSAPLPRGVYAGLHRAFGLPELTTGIVRLRLGPALIGLEGLGFDGYREQTMRARVARLVGPFRLGVGAGVRLGLPSGYRTQWTAMGALGLQRPIGSAWTVGLTWTTDSVIAGGGFRYPAGIAILDLVHNGHGLSLAGGWRHHLSPAFSLGAGVASQPARISVSARLTAGRIACYLASDRHEPLGWSQSVGVSWSF